MICVLSVNRNQKRLTISFVTVLILSLSGRILNLYYLLFRKQQVQLSLKDTLIGVLRPECPLLNYLILIGKIYLWSCRRNEVPPNIESFKVWVNIKYETENYICTNNKSLEKNNGEVGYVMAVINLINLEGQVHGSAHAHLSKRCFSSGTCCIVYARNVIMS